MAPTSSSRAIQLIHCPPVPSFPPTPSLNGRSILASAPPPPERTMPVRMWLTRIPASRAGSAAASHARHTSARNPSPDRLLSVSTSSPRSP